MILALKNLDVMGRRILNKGDSCPDAEFADRLIDTVRRRGFVDVLPDAIDEVEVQAIEAPENVQAITRPPEKKHTPKRKNPKRLKAK